MRFHLTINVVRATEWGLSFPQAGLFAFLYELPAWATCRTNDAGIRYYLATHSKIAEELPILKMKKDTIYRNIKALINAGLVERWIVDGRNDYYAITEKGALWNSTQQTLDGIDGGGGTPDLNPTSDLNPGSPGKASPADQGVAQNEGENSDNNDPQGDSPDAGGDFVDADDAGVATTSNIASNGFKNAVDIVGRPTPDLNPTSDLNPTYPGFKSGVTPDLNPTYYYINNKNITYPSPPTPQVPEGEGSPVCDQFFMDAVLAEYQAVAVTTENWSPQRTLTSENVFEIRDRFNRHDMATVENWREYFQAIATTQFIQSMPTVTLRFLLKEQTLINAEGTVYHNTTWNKPRRDSHGQI